MRWASLGLAGWRWLSTLPVTPRALVGLLVAWVGVVGVVMLLPPRACSR